MRTNLTVITLLCLALTFGGSALAQDVDPAQAIKNWEPLVGHWVNEEQQRETPDGSWQKAASEWDIKMMPGGFFVETPGKLRFADGGEVSWVQVWGYDPVNEEAFQHWFASDGVHGEGFFRFSGTTQNSGGSVTLADGSQQTIRCEWIYSSDYKSSEGSCERLTGGKWWTFRKVKGKKVE
jgi:hypothetical protein